MIPEFSRPIRADQISSKGTEVELEANADERAALARRFGIPAIDSLEARLRLKAIRGGQLVQVKGELTADVVQSCVVTLDPVPARVEEKFSMTFGPEADEDGEGEIEISVDEEEAPDPMIDGIIDMGEAVAEHLALALDPFPRKPGAKVPGALRAEPVADERPHPFAKLALLRQKKE